MRYNALPQNIIEHMAAARDKNALYELHVHVQFPN